MNIKMDIKLVVDGIEVKVGIELASNIVSSLKDDKSNIELFAKFAQHPSSSIRKEVAYKDNLSAETAKLLLKDKDSSVLCNILRSTAGKENLDEVDFDYVLSTSNEEAITNLISSIDDYELIDDKKECYKKILELNNDYLTLQVAEDYNTPKMILKKLVKHNDPDVVAAAKYSLD